MQAKLDNVQEGGNVPCNYLEANIYEPMQKNTQRIICCNSEIHVLYKDVDIVTHIILKCLEWAGQVFRMDGT
jgi:hypothetical protein